MLDNDPVQRPYPRVPKIPPDRWEDFCTFRETFLADVGDAENNQAFRTFAKLQISLVHEGGGVWPYTYMDATAHYLQAALADLRQLQGFLVFTCQRTEEDREGDREQSKGDEEVVKKHDALCRLGNRISKMIGALADELEKEVGRWQFD